MQFPWLIAAVALPGWAAPPLQPLIDATPAGGVLVLDGNGAAVVRGGGHGTVLTVHTSGAVVRRLRITASGESNDGMDAGLALEGNGNRIVDNVIDDVLFGIRVAQGDTPHEVYLYADRIWMVDPMAKFFRNSPVFEMLDFLEWLAPFAAPAKILSDPSPRTR